MKNLSTLSAEQLKAHLKTLGMSQSGDKGTLLHRALLHEKCTSKGLLVDGENPCLLRIGDLRKAVSINGLSPIGSQDELLESLVNHLESSVSSRRSSEQVGNSRSNDVDAVAIARRILELDENDDYEGILSLAGCGAITKNSAFPIIRKAYLKLSLIVHPDKLGSSFDQATKSFQALVRAVERLSMQDVTTEETSDNKSNTGTTKSTKTKTIARSNEGCFRTRVCCPRCKEVWSEGSLDGNPEYFYNFLMLGLKQYTCSTCLFEFGCLTAIHKCPFCKGIFEYSPQDYHRKIGCGNHNCQKLFGFYMFNTSDRVMKDMKKEVKDEMERRARSKEAKQRRANKHKHSNNVNEEAAFVMGLSDCCPRCGESLEDYSDEDAQRQHLMNCTDESKHKSFKKAKAAQEKKQMEKALRQEKQESAQTRAAWEFLGAQTNQLWLLDDSQLQVQAAEAGLVLGAGLDRDDLIAAIATHRHSKEDIAGSDSNIAASNSTGQLKAITDGSGVIVTAAEGTRGRKSKPTAKRSRLTADSVPSNLHSMGVRELRAVCAAHGFRPVGSSKADILSEIEEELCEGREGGDKRLSIGDRDDVVDLT